MHRVQDKALDHTLSYQLRAVGLPQFGRGFYWDNIYGLPIALTRRDVEAIGGANVPQNDKTGRYAYCPTLEDLMHATGAASDECDDVEIHFVRKQTGHYSCTVVLGVKHWDATSRSSMGDAQVEALAMVLLDILRPPSMDSLLDSLMSTVVVDEGDAFTELLGSLE